jgi:hypothetical protein
MRYLATLRRIPDDVILSMATRPINLNSAAECVCGWAAREIVARQQNIDAEDAAPFDPTGVLADTLGDDAADWWGEWSRINGAGPGEESGDELEEAFVERVLECVS